jgi:hypothetical protein
MVIYSIGIIPHISGSLKRLKLNFSYVFRNDARHTREIQSRTAMERAEFNKNKALFTRKLDLNLKKKLVKCYIRSKALWSDGYFRT